MRIDVLGVGFDNLTMAEAVERGMELVRSPGPHYVVTPNPEIVEVCREDSGGQGRGERRGLWCCRTASASSRARPCWGRL